MDEGRTVDLEALSAPIAGAAPAGPDLRDPGSAQSSYIAIKDARAAARNVERRADEDGQLATGFPPEWRKVFQLTQDSLQRESKDLEVACWLVEALVRARGFAGLRDGFALLNRLVDKYWGTLHSLKDEQGMATFVFPLTMLNGEDRDGTLIQPINKVPLTSGGDASFAAYHYKQALALGQVTDKATRERRLASGIPTVEAFELAVKSSPKGFLRALWTNLQASLTELEALRALLDAKCGKAVPPVSRIREALEGVQDILRPYAPPPEVATTGNGATPPGGEKDASGESPAEPAMTATISSREDALRLLARASAYFRTAEPHSPLAFALDDLIRRARMTLPELLTELLPDANARRMFLTSAGIKPDAAPAAGSTPAQKS
jgi:type VI secretion system protein ImpA